jgi:hypothetical protein
LLSRLKAVFAVADEGRIQRFEGRSPAFGAEVWLSLGPDWRKGVAHVFCVNSFLLALNHALRFHPNTTVTPLPTALDFSAIRFRNAEDWMQTVWKTVSILNEVLCAGAHEVRKAQTAPRTDRRR